MTGIAAPAAMTRRDGNEPMATTSSALFGPAVDRSAVAARWERLLAVRSSRRWAGWKNSRSTSVAAPRAQASSPQGSMTRSGGSDGVAVAAAWRAIEIPGAQSDALARDDDALRIEHRGDGPDDLARRGAPARSRTTATRGVLLGERGEVVGRHQPAGDGEHLAHERGLRGQRLEAASIGRTSSAARPAPPPGGRSRPHRRGGRG